MSRGLRNGPTMTPDLPANVRPVKDRHGKIRYRFRKKGWQSAYLPGKPGTAEFHRAYAELLEHGRIEPLPAQSPRKVAPKSIDDLIRRYKVTPNWRDKAGSTQRVQAAILERFADRVAKSGKRYGERPVADVSVAWLEAVLSQMWETPAAANVLRKVLSGLMDHARRIGWRPDNPVGLTSSYKEGKGFEDWSEDDIEQFRKTHAIGTMARLTLELALNTAARRCNIATLTRDHIIGDRIYVEHAKGNNTTSVPLLLTTKAALEALPAAPIRHLIVTQFGKPFSVAGLGNRMRKWCDEAGLKNRSMHGLRKAVSRRVAESGGTDAQGQAITGHKRDKTFAEYRAKANRALLADAAMSNLSARFVVQPKKDG